MEIHYSVTMEEPGTHYFRVAMSLEGLRGTVPSDLVRLAMPVWTPGSYLVREFARNVLDLAATDGSGTTIPVRKDAKNSWVLDLGGADRLVVTYRVYAFRHDTNQSYLDTDHAVINGASVFLYLDGHTADPLTVEVVPAPGWNVVSTGLERQSPGSRTFAAASYDILVDSPIQIGNQHVHSFEVQGTRHEVSIFARKQFDEAGFVSDVRKLVETTIPVFAEVPYSRYVFIVDFTDQGFGGLEHLNSTHCIAPYLMLEPPAEYHRLLSLFSHEFFHAWNVKSCRPLGLGPFDYSKEVYTKSLWIAEGLTSYYEDLILRRAGIVSVAEFLDLLADDMSQIKSLPSSTLLSPQESSFDTWIRFYREDENSPNVSPSYYRQGAVLGTLLDLAIRRHSHSSATLDDVMKRVYRETYKEGRGYTDDEFETSCSDASRGGTDEIFERHVRGKEEIDFPRHLSAAALTLVPKAVPEPSEGFLGVKVRANQGLTVVSRLFGSPAESADVSAGDEIIALDGLRMDAQRLPFYLANRVPGTEVILTSVREGMLRETRVKLGQRPPFEFRIQKADSASPEEKDLFKSWAHAEWDQPIKYDEHRVSPARAKRLDFV